MVKHVFFKMSLLRLDALAILGWLAFAVGTIVDKTWLKLILLSAARVLP